VKMQSQNLDWNQDFFSKMENEDVDSFAIVWACFVIQVSKLVSYGTVRTIPSSHLASFLIGLHAQNRYPTWLNTKGPFQLVYILRCEVVHHISDPTFTRNIKHGSCESRFTLIPFEKKSPIKENQKSVTQKPVRDKWIIVIACNTHPVLFHFIILKWCSKATLIYNSRAFIKQFDGTANTRGSHGLHSCTLMTLLNVVNRRDSWVLAKHRRIAYMLYISPCHRVLLVSYNNGLFNSAKVCQN
jgi:hypothetical protein